jgi:hypothetical protein
VAVSVHNAPARVLGDALPPGSVSLGAEGYGLSGWPQSRLYTAAGLTEEQVWDQICALLYEQDAERL